VRLFKLKKNKGFVLKEFKDVFFKDFNKNLKLFVFVYYP